jgi:hypothetical protein
VRPVVDWLRTTGGLPERVWFYLHPETPDEILRPWADAGFAIDQVEFVKDWRQLHPHFGLALNDRVYADWMHLA